MQPIPVMIVDDDPITRMDLAELLDGAGYQTVCQAADGFDAIELCRNLQPEIILMDIKMPLFDGFSSVERIRSEMRSVCIVMLTAYNDPEYIARAKQLGVMGYLVKPLDERTLLTTLAFAYENNQKIQALEHDCEQLQLEFRCQRTINEAKSLLAHAEGISELEAYQLMRKLSMDKRAPIASIAEAIIANGTQRSIVERAKKRLMQRFHIDEADAYRRITQYRLVNGCTIEEAAQKSMEGV